MGLLVLKEKHGDLYFHYTTNADLFEIFRRIIVARNRDGWYNDLNEDERDQLERTLSGDLKAAENFMYYRQHHEYEGFSLETLSYSGSYLN